MCRLVAYLGEPVTLSSVLLEPEHALVVQQVPDDPLVVATRTELTVGAIP